MKYEVTALRLCHKLRCVTHQAGEPLWHCSSQSHSGGFRTASPHTTRLTQVPAMGKVLATGEAQTNIISSCGFLEASPLPLGLVALADIADQHDQPVGRSSLP